MSLQQSNLLKVVVAFLDGRRTKGYTLNFSPLRDCFDLLPQDNPLQDPGTRVYLREVKAVFFVKDFAGNPAHKDSPVSGKQGYGKKMEIIMVDGEQIVGLTPEYKRHGIGFFLIPVDPNGNNTRIFVVNENTRQIKQV